MSKKFDVVVTQRYQDRDGNEQKKFVNIGSVIETSKGMSIKLESIPLGWDGWAAFYEPKPKEGQQNRSGKQQGRQSNDFDDTPF
jgi:hypothetical protein